MTLMREPEQLWGLERTPLTQGDSEASGSNPHPKYCALLFILLFTVFFLFTSILVVLPLPLNP